PAYKISGTADNKTVGPYLDTLLDNRIAEKLPEGEDTDADRSRRDLYRVHLIQSDLKKGLEAKGNYDGTVTFHPAKDGGHGEFVVKAGQQYHLNKVKIEPKEYQAYAAALKIKPGDALDAQAVLDSEQALLLAISKDHCYFRLNATHIATIQPARKNGDIVFELDVGRDAHYGPVTFNGTTTIRESYLRKMIPWKEGDCFRSDQIESFRAALLESGLFVRAEAILPGEPDEDGMAPVTINLTERAQRTIKAGFNYYTDEGFGTTFGWEHRNIFGAAEKFNIDLGLSQLKQSLNLDLVKPFFLRKDQALSFNNSYRHQDTDAYKETALDLGTSLSRKFNRYLSGTTGAKFTLSRIDDKAGVTDSYGLFSLPQNLGYDNRDSKLDPHKGWVISGTVAPFFDMLGNSDPFLKTQLTASTYLPLAKKSDIVLALRGSVGSIIGPATSSVPATERFYAGGGGSVRGYGYQAVGPSKDGKATGGRSLVESSAELRFRITDTVGGVTFIDGGSVSDNAAPDFDNLAFGAGVGVRYYTALGPLRFDIGVPLSKTRNEDDRSYQFYISIGQAF
ncbi:MAG: surface antigen family protein, partial [Micavibrio sp.]|nr:surface antigen family protein [Micavibrio sp.]